MLNPTSHCQYLYGKPTQDVFETKLGENVIDQCLATLMSVHVFLFSNRDPFFLIQPTAYNDQCHLYGLRTVQIMRVYSQMTESEKEARNETNRFLHLSLLLSFAFIINPHFYVEMVQQGLKELKAQRPAKRSFPTRKALTQFFTALESRQSKAAAREAYNQVFTTYAKASVLLMKEREGATALDLELFNLFTTENLSLHPRLDDGEGPTQEGRIVFYTPPKFAGVALMMNMLEMEEIPFAIKVMAITKQGTGVLSFISKKPQESEPVLIFEAFATDGSLTLQECREIAMHCPSYHRKSSSIPSHPGATCLFCNPQRIDLSPFQARLGHAAQNPRRMFLALGADYVLSSGTQTKYLKYFKDEERYPLLTALFQEATLDIDALGLSMHKPLTFSVSFAYADNGASAMSERMLSNQPCIHSLKERKLTQQIKQGERK